MTKHDNPLGSEEVPSQTSEKGPVNAVFERMIKSTHYAAPVPFRTLVRNAADLSSWQKVMRQNTMARPDLHCAPDGLAAIEKLVRNALEKARETSRDGLEKI